jgi:hypothetical protein
VLEIERKVRASHPQVVTLFVKPQTDKSYQAGMASYFTEQPRA